MKTALLTAVGSASAGIVIERLHALGYRVAGCDIYPQAWNVASGEVDVFFQAVRASEADAYVRQMEEAVRRERADVLIPLTDVEVDALCARKERFAALAGALAGQQRGHGLLVPAQAGAGLVGHAKHTSQSRKAHLVGT